jgi:hypothetical protein
MFRFTVCFEPSKDGSQHGCWFFCENGPGRRFHSGHFPKKECEVTEPVPQLDSNELETTDDGQDVNTSSAAVAMPFQNQAGLATNPQKLRNYHQARQKARRLASAASANLTPAEKVVNKLVSGKQVSVVCLVADAAAGEGLAATCTSAGKSKSKKPKASKESGNKLTVTFSTNVTKKGGETAVGSVTSEEIMAMAGESDSGDTPRSTAVEIYGSLESTTSESADPHFFPSTIAENSSATLLNAANDIYLHVCCHSNCLLDFLSSPRRSPWLLILPRRHRRWAQCFRILSRRLLLPAAAPTARNCSSSSSPV